MILFFFITIAVALSPQSTEQWVGTPNFTVINLSQQSGLNTDESTERNIDRACVITSILMHRDMLTQSCDEKSTVYFRASTVGFRVKPC